MHFVLVAVGEAGANGAVDHAGGERSLVGRTGLALEVAARDATDCIHLLDEVDSQGEEVVIGLLLAHDGGYQNGGIALSDQYGTRCLLRQFAGFESVRLSVQLE